MGLPSLYLDLAHKRASTCFPGYKQPEEFGYDFKDWVSPYTKTAHAFDGIAVVLQDWSSEDKLSQGVIPAVQKYGRDPDLKTNKILDRLLREVLNLSVEQTYATNVFPYIKPGDISKPIPFPDVTRAAREFAVPELRLARPSRILALGKMASTALREVGVECIALPHPAARMSISAQVEAWRRELGS